MQQHTDPTALIDYALGRLSRRSAAELRAHCLRCRECGDQLAAAIALRLHARGSADPGVDWRRVAAVAAAVVLAVGIAAIGFVGDGSEVRGPATEIETVADGPARMPPDSVRAVDELRSRMVPLSFVFRGSAAAVAADDDRLSRIRAAMVRLDAGDLAGMAHALEPFGANYDPWGTPMLGVARYLAGDGGVETISYLDAARARATREIEDPGDTYLERVAAFYLARLERDRGRDAEAEAILVSLLAFEDSLAEDSRAILESLEPARR